MRKTKMLTQAGLFVAIYVVFFLVSRYSGGFLESILFFILPLPLIVFTYNYGVKYAIIPYISTALIGFFINPLSTLFYVLSANVVGIVYGEMVRKNVKSKVLFIVCVISSCIVEVLTCLVFAELFEYDITIEIKDLFKFILKIIGLSFENEIITTRVITATIPLFIFTIGFMEGLTTHAVASSVLAKLKIRDNTLGNMYKLTLPIWTAFVYIAFLVLHLLTIKFFYDGTEGLYYTLSFIFLEIFWFIGLIFFARGFIFLVLYFARKNISRVFALIIILALVLFSIPTIFIISIFGLIAVFNDKRKYLLYNK